MLKHPEKYPYNKIKSLIQNASTKEARLIGALAYATGSRVSELNKITASDIQTKDGYLEIICPVLKKRKKDKNGNWVRVEASRIAIVNLKETWLVDNIKQLANGKEPDEILIPFYRMKIWRILNSSFGINPHGFRKIRATNLAQLGYTGHQLKNFFGWANVAPSDYYVRLNTKDLRYEVDE
jgi:integrase